MSTWCSYKSAAVSVSHLITPSLPMTEVDEKNESSFPSSREPFDEESIVTGARTPVPLSPLSLSQKEAPTNSVYPDGGLQANLTVLGAFVALFCTFGQMNAFGTFQAWYASHQLAGINASTISWIGSLQLWIFFFSVSRHMPCLFLAECPNSRRDSLSVVFSTSTDRNG